MLRSFLLITLRILWRNKVTSFVNIFSLSIGITAFIFIMLYVQHEMSYDKSEANYDRIYRLEADEFGKLPPIVGMTVKARVPEVENIAFLALQGKGALGLSLDANPANKKWVEGNFYLADSTTFDVLTFPFVQGNPKTALKQPMTVVVTESFAKKLFGNDNPMGKTVEFMDHVCAITGVIRDITTSHLEIDFLGSYSSFAKAYPDRDLSRTGPNSWAWSATYLLMSGPVDEKLVEDKINRALAEINNGKVIDIEFKRFHIRPFRDLYFNGEVQKLSYGLHGNLKTILILVSLGAFLLLLAGINYVNLTTARSAIRAKEIAVKRVTGSSANLLRFQLIAESVIISLVSLAVALTIVQLLLPKFNEVALVNIQLAELNRPLVWTAIIGGGMLIGVLAGLYPAFYLTALEPVRLLKGGIRGSEGVLFRRGLMTFQFALSIVMIIAIIVNFRQLHYLRSTDLGFSKQRIVTVDTPADIPNEYVLRETFRTKLKRHPGIDKVAFSWGTPGTAVSDSPTLEINGIRGSLKSMLIDAEYLDAMGIAVVQGRGFSFDRPGDKFQMPSERNARLGSALMNEAAVQQFGMENPVGQMINYSNDTSQYSYEIIGVVRDFHFASLHDRIQPLLMWWPESGITASIKIAPSDIPATLKAIETEFKSVWTQAPYSYRFLDEDFNRQYERDEQLAVIIGYFTGLAVIIACLGLFALSSFMVSSRIKEIGVRKALGASVGTIYGMLSWDFLKWILVAIVFACPCAWYLMHLWLETFAYHVPLGADVFLIAALLAMAIALITVTGKSLKAARANPIDSLRYE